MGGRSRKPRDERVERFQFVQELSDERLEHYGQYSNIGYQNIDTPTQTEQGIPVNHEGLNAAAADEYQRRNGRNPEWDLRENESAERNRRKKLGFKDA